MGDGCQTWRVRAVAFGNRVYHSRLGCIAGESYGCAPGGRLQTAADSKRQQNPNDSAVWVEQSCRGLFMCGTGSHPVMCGKPGQEGVGRRFLCRCYASRTLKPVDFGVSPITSAGTACMYAGTTSDSASASPFARLGGSPAGARPCSSVLARGRRVRGQCASEDRLPTHFGHRTFIGGPAHTVGRRGCGRRQNHQPFRRPDPAAAASCGSKNCVQNAHSLAGSYRTATCR